MANVAGPGESFVASLVAGVAWMIAAFVAVERAKLSLAVAGIVAGARLISQVLSQVLPETRTAVHRQRPQVLHKKPQSNCALQVSTYKFRRNCRASFLLAMKSTRMIHRNMRQILRLCAKHATILAESVASFAEVLSKFDNSCDRTCEASLL